MKTNLISKSETNQIIKLVSDQWKRELPKIKNLKVHFIDNNSQLMVGDWIIILKINDDYLPQTQFPQYKDSPNFKNENKRKEFLKKNNLRFLRYYQVDAIKAIQSKIRNGGDRFLLEMATGTGKTTTSAAIIKMFLRLYKVNRVLFLVDSPA